MTYVKIVVSYFTSGKSFDLLVYLDLFLANHKKNMLTKLDLQKKNFDVN